MIRARDIDPDTWNAVEDAVLCFVRDLENNKVLLINKKTGLGAGLINAPGGRIENGETPVAAAIRETREEVGLTVDRLNHGGDLYFQFLDGHSIRGFVFWTEHWSGEPIETSEADPFWCEIRSIPYEKMWSDDSWWLPHLLGNRPFVGRFVFDGENMMSMSMDVEPMEGHKTGIPRAEWRDSI